MTTITADSIQETASSTILPSLHSKRIVSLHLGMSQLDHFVRDPTTSSFNPTMLIVRNIRRRMRKSGVIFPILPYM